MYQFADTRAEEIDPETQRFDYVFTTGGKVRIPFLVWWIGGWILTGVDPQYRHRLLLNSSMKQNHKTHAQRMRGDGLTYSQLGVNGHISFFTEVQRRCVIFWLDMWI